MTKILTLISLLLVGSLNLNAQSFSKMATEKPTLTQSGKEKHWCPVCGMSIKMFYKTSHASILPNEKSRQYCSMRCLVVDKKEYNLDLSTVKVIDAKTQKLIDAQSAFYVVKSKVKGTMTKVSKLAFASKTDAKSFIESHRGKIVTFKEAFAMAENSIKSDIVMVTKKKEKKMYPMGKKIFSKMCSKNIDPNNYIEINELKADIKKSNLCKPLKEKQLQAVALYLFEVKRFGDLAKNLNAIVVPKDAKCPICGMFVYKYPRWASKMITTKELYFDGAKDMFKYYFEHKSEVKSIVVTDYYSQKSVDAKKAFYVLGSDVYGPMGDELIPFKSEEDAKTFYMDHKGKKVVKFSDVTKTEVYKLDE